MNARQDDGRLRRRILLFVSTLVFAGPGCDLSRRVAKSASVEMMKNLSASVQRQPDPELVRQGLPTFVLLTDALLADSPNDPELLLAATNAYADYCRAFVPESDNSRAIRLYERAWEYGIRLLRQYEFFDQTVDGPVEDYELALEQFTVDDVPKMQAAAAAWLGWIVADDESMEALAELPKALALAERVLELDESYGAGSSHLIFGLYFAVQPRGAGQDLDRSRNHFERAIELAGPRNLLPKVLYAEYYGKATLDEKFFTQKLEEVLETDPKLYPENRLVNELAQQRARHLLSSREDIF